MENQEAITILQRLLAGDALDAQEKEAVTTALGVLSWLVLTKGKMKARKAKLDKSTEW